MPCCAYTHIVLDHEVTQVGHQGHGSSGMLAVDEVDTPKVHDEAHRPCEQQLTLGDLHTALREYLHEAYGRKRERETVRDRNGRETIHGDRDVGTVREDGKCRRDRET